MLLLVFLAATDLDPQAFQTKATADKGIILDVRTPDEISRGKIKDATTIDWKDERFEKKAALMQKDRPIFVYCAAGGRSAKAAEKLEQLGFTKVYNLAGGLTAWKASGLPVVVANDPKPAKQGITPDAFDAVVKKEPRVLAVFGTEWCTPCQQMQPLVAALAQELKGKVTFISVDLEASEALATREKIQGVPRFAFYKNGKLVWAKQGEIAKDVLAKELMN